jgi:hypothetical protein
MKSIGLLLLVSAVAFGQRGTGAGAGGVRIGGSAGNAYSHANTYGSITSSVVHAGHGSTLNTFPLNTFPGSGVGGGVGRYRQRTGAIVYVPYAVGGYYGGYYYGDQGGQAPANYPQQQPMGPQVIINQNFAPDVARPVVREYVPDAGGGIRIYGPQSQGNDNPAPVAEESPTFLIAFKDHTIYAALAYWVEGDTLHYVTNQNTHNQVSLDLVDRELSDRLNRERQVDFRLPPRK